MIDIIDNNNEEIIVKQRYIKWSFKPDDKIVETMIHDNYFFYEVMILREYKIKDIDELVLYILPKIQKKRQELEDKNVSFQEKKVYLANNINNNKIQININEEYKIKNLVEKYKIYEFIRWFHLCRNDKIVEYCDKQKSDILNDIYPLVYLSICKVIGSKVVSPSNYDIFEDVVNMAWVNIIKYIPKMDTSKVMFSIFVATAQNSAKNFRANYREDNYKMIKMTDLEAMLNVKNDEEASENFLDGYLQINNLLEANNIDDSIENLINEMDYDSVIDEMYQDTNNINHIQKQVEQYSYNVLTYSKQKSIINLFRIYAEFFIELINNNIPITIIQKHSNSILNIFDINSQINYDKKDEKRLKEDNKNIYKFFKDYIRYKIQIKLSNSGIDQNNLSLIKMKQHNKIAEDEFNMLNILQENQHKMLFELLKYRNYANSGVAQYN
jgi:hypothetical protein